MLKENQVWENKIKVAKLEKHNGGMQALIFKIKCGKLHFLDIIHSDNKDIEVFLKRAKMHPTNKILTISE